jgi:hypothetical protein
MERVKRGKGQDLDQTMTWANIQSPLHRVVTPRILFEVISCSVATDGQYILKTL